MATFIGSRLPVFLHSRYEKNGFTYEAASTVLRTIGETANSLTIEARLTFTSDDPDFAFSGNRIVRVTTTITGGPDEFTIGYTMRDASSGAVLMEFADVKATADQAEAYARASTDSALYALFLKGNDKIVGSEFDDFLIGREGNDRIEGGLGDDVIQTSVTGRDKAYGGAGDDLLIARSRDSDIIDGGDGDDVLQMGFWVTSRTSLSSQPTTFTGGAGSDRFEFSNYSYLSDRPVITDFNPDEDVLALSIEPVLEFETYYREGVPGGVGSYSLKTSFLELAWSLENALFTDALEAHGEAVPNLYVPGSEAAPFRDEIYVAGFNAERNPDVYTAYQALAEFGRLIEDPATRQDMVAALLSGRPGRFTAHDGDTVVVRALGHETEDAAWFGGLQFIYDNGFNLVVSSLSTFGAFYADGNIHLPTRASDTEDYESFIISAPIYYDYEFTQDGDDLIIDFGDSPYDGGSVVRLENTTEADLNAQNFERPDRPEVVYPWEIGDDAPSDPYTPTELPDEPVGWTVDRTSGLILLDGFDLDPARIRAAYLVDAPDADRLADPAGVDIVASEGRIQSGGLGDDTIRVDVIGAVVRGFEGDDTLIIRGDVPTLEYGQRLGGRANMADGGAGDDHVIGFGYAFGGDGADRIEFAEGIAPADLALYAYGEAGPDHLTGGAAIDTLDGGGDADIIEGGGGNDKIEGGDGDDVVNGGAGHDRINGGDGDDVLEGGAGRDTLDGGDGDDTLSTDAGSMFGGDGDDRLTGGASNNTLEGGAGADYLEGGAGDDKYVLEDVLDMIVEAADGGFDEIIAPFYVPLPENVERLRLGNGVADAIVAGDGADDIIGDHRANSIDGAGGDDQIDGGAGNDVLEGGDGDDVLDGGIDDDEVQGGAGDDRLDGGSGDDTLRGGPGADLLKGGSGDDIYILDDLEDTIFYGSGYNAIWAPFVVDLPHGVQQFRLIGDLALDLDGTAGRDDYWGNDQKNVIRGFDGNDLLHGGGGDDILIGGARIDWLYGGAGDDVYVLEDALDRIIEVAGEGYDIVRTAVDAGFAPHVEEVDLTDASGGRLTGSARGETLRGDLGDDLLKGGGGDDRLIGEEGDDQLVGGDGRDELQGGAGANVLRGGGGDDVYIVVDPLDRIIELAGEGWDVIQAALAMVLPQNVEEFRLVGEAAVNLSGRGDAGEALWANDADNILKGFGGDDALYGQGGDDTVIGHEGRDRLFGDDGDDTLSGGDDDDRAWGGLGADKVWAGSGADVVFGGEGDDILKGGEGDDNIFADGGADTVSGEAGDDLIRGHAGDDTLLGGDGEDRLLGWADDDLLDGGLGADRMWGGTGSDTYFVDDLGDWIKEYGRDDGVDTAIVSVDGYRAAYHLELVQLDLAAGGTLKGSFFNDHLAGDVGADLLLGYMGHDRLSGGDGDDLLLGHEGYDVLEGGAGDDVLRGGLGRDSYTGGAGADRFLLESGGGLDRVYDFELGVDLLDLRGFDLESFEAFQALASTRTSGYTLVDLGGEDIVLLYGVVAEEIAARDVLL